MHITSYKETLLNMVRLHPLRALLRTLMRRRLPSLTTLRLINLLKMLTIHNPKLDSEILALHPRLVHEASELSRHKVTHQLTISPSSRQIV